MNMIKQGGHYCLHLKIQNGSHLKGHIQYLTSAEHNLLPTKINIGKKQRQPEFGGNALGFLVGDLRGFFSRG